MVMEVEQADGKGEFWIGGKTMKPGLRCPRCGWDVPKPILEALIICGNPNCDYSKPPLARAEKAESERDLLKGRICRLEREHNELRAAWENETGKPWVTGEPE